MSFTVDQPRRVVAQQREALRGYTARTVVVPVANPRTAAALIRVAHLLLGERPGRLVVCVVLVDDRDSEEQRDHVSEIEQHVKSFADSRLGCEVQWQTTFAPSVARGVLDTIRDTGADALVIGANTDTSGRLRVGAVGNSILDAVPCDVFVLGMRNGCALDNINRILVAIEDPSTARAALHTGALVSRDQQRPLEVLHILRRGMPGSAWLRQVMSEIDERDTAVITNIPEVRLDVGLARHTRDRDLLIVGYEHGAGGQGWAEGSLTRRVLSKHDVSVLTLARHPAPGSESEHLLRRAAAWLHPRLTAVEQDSIRGMAAAASRLRLDFMLMILLSGSIAAFGLLLDSVAIIIGAMLVAPLMAPIQAFGIAVVDGRPAVATRAAATVAVGALLVILGSLGLGLLSDPELTDEIAVRGAPSLLDAGVALAAGLAGAYATARKTIPAALAGVAIAAALVPPLAVVGLAASMGIWRLSVGAMLLFVVNIVCIATTTAGVFTWLGLQAFDPERRRNPSPHYLLGAVLTLVLLLAVSVALQTESRVLDEARLASVVGEASNGRAALVHAVMTDSVESGLTVRVVVDLVGEVDQARQAGAKRLLAVLEDDIHRQLGSSVEVRLVWFESLSSDGTGSRSGSDAPQP